MDPAFRRQVKALIRPATYVWVHPLAAASSLGLLATKFGGTPYAEHGDEWPLCGCGSGLMFIFQCNLAECTDAARRDCAESASAGIFALYYCFDCEPWGDSPEDPDGAWIVRRYAAPAEAAAINLTDASPREGRIIPCEVGLKTGPSLPDWQELDELAPEVKQASCAAHPEEPWEPYRRAAALELGETQHRRTQIGGYPQFVQGAEVARCPVCSAHMRLLAQIDSELDADIMWADSGCLYLFECPRHTDQIQMRIQSL